MATINANTLCLQNCVEELASRMQKYNIDILGIQEHRRIHWNEELNFEVVEELHLVTSSAWREPTTNTSQGGVGLLLYTKARKSLWSVTWICNCILVAEFEGNPACTVIVCYSPHNASEDLDIDTFYTQLHTAIGSVPAHNVLTVLGNFNARLGHDDAMYTYHETTNCNAAYWSIVCRRITSGQQILTSKNNETNSGHRKIVPLSWSVNWIIS